MSLESKFKFQNISPHGATLFVPKDLSYFDGHFPENPVLPAFAILEASVDLIRIIVGRELQLVQVSTSRFLAPIVPLDTVQIRLEQNSSGGWQIEWIGSDQKQKLAQLALQFL